MAIVKTTAAGRYPLTLGERVGALTQQKKQLFEEKDIFTSPNSVTLTPLGQAIQQILIETSALLDSQLSQSRRDEIISEIERVNRKAGLGGHSFSQVDRRFRCLVQERCDKMAHQYPISKTPLPSSLELKDKPPVIRFFDKIIWRK